MSMLTNKNPPNNGAARHSLRPGWAMLSIVSAIAVSSAAAVHAEEPANTAAAFGDPAQSCADQINSYRASVGRAPLARNFEQEACVATESQRDGEANTPHASFGQCGEFGQCECPGANGDPGSVEQTISRCLQAMWDEGPGGGHHDIMMSDSYHSVACGYAFVNGSLWATQSYFF